MRPLPPLGSVRVFDSAARHQNFTAAAAELGMTQAAVSYQIRLLEERLGLPLFARIKGRVSLTDAGRRAAPLVAAGFDKLEEAFGALVADDQALLSISTATTFATVWLAPRLGSFQVRHPDLAVRLSTDNRLVDFSSGEYHAAIRMGRGNWPGLRCHFLFRLNVTPICSPDFAERHRLTTPDRIAQAPRLAPDDIWWREWLEAMGVDAPPAQARPGLVLDNQVMEANAVVAGSGLALMTPLFWQDDLAAGRLVQPFPHILFPGPAYWLVYPEGRRSQPKIAAFREWMLGEVKAAAAAYDGPAEVFTPVSVPPSPSPS